MTSNECNIQIICADPRLTREYASEMLSVGEPYHLLLALSPAEARREFARVKLAVILFDESAAALEGSLESTVALLTEVAPVVVVAAPDRQPQLTFLITSGAVDFVARAGNFVAITAGLIERRARMAATADSGFLSGNGEELIGDFGEILRHEVNNPLTGILGNAEMLLACSDRLPASAIERLETIAELAVRLRETVRRLSNAWGVRHDHVGSA